MKRTMAWVGGLTMGGIVVALAWALLRPEPQRSVVVHLDSVPSGASLFSDNAFFAAAPVTIRMEPGEVRRFRVVKRDFADGFVSLRADDFLGSTVCPRWWVRRWPPREILRVPLTPVPSSTLSVTSNPSGALVYVDGRRVGITPLLAEGLSPGRHTFLVDHPDCYCDIFETDLKPGERNVAHRPLRSKFPVIYRELLAKEPGALACHTELIQYYVMAGDYPNAVACLRDGYEALKRPDAVEQDEYFTILMKINNRWFEYPEEGDMANMRGFCRELILKARKERVWDVSGIQKHIDAMDQYDRIRRRR